MEHGCIWLSYNFSNIAIFGYRSMAVFSGGGGRQGFRHREHMPAIGLFVSIFVLVKPYGDQYFTILGKHYIR